MSVAYIPSTQAMNGVYAQFYKMQKKDEMKFSIKDVIMIITIIVGILSSYFVGQAKSSSRVDILETKVKTLQRDMGRIYNNQIKQDDKNTEMYGLIYTAINHS